ncbi:MAG TPA: bacillithiol biosynthesis cysteine-adding enzyme BshC [Bryobacteraceae bacterium]|jgi:bacillithiol biosynthesis cysteine-adding enzyme BshC
MDGACIRHTELPGTSRLFADYLYSFDRVAEYYRHSPQALDALPSVASAIDYPDGRRAAMVAALKAQNGGGPNLDRLAQPGTVAVVTGQQVGLFSGPAYTIYKALSAVRMARELTAQGTPAVPVFWLATEDHDFAEISKVWMFNAAEETISMSVESPGASDGPVGPVVPAHYPIEELCAAFRGFEFSDEVTAMVKQAYRPGQSFGGAFRELLQALLRRFDLLYLDPLDPAIRAIAAPFLKQALEDGDELYPALIERGKSLERAKYHAQVHIDGQTSLFFLLDGGRRIPLRRQGDRYLGRDRSYSLAELTAQAERISPNALLRPVMQDYLLPTVAYVGGPAELAYFAQSEVLYMRLLGRMPMMLPRNGFTLVDSRSAKLMERYRFQLPSLFAGEDSVRESIAQQLLPDGVRSAIAQTKADAGASLDSLVAQLNGFDSSLAKSLAKSRAKIEYQLEKIERKTARESLKRDERATRDAAHLMHLLYPHKHLQERLYSILPFVAKHGFELIDRIEEHTCIDCVDHHVMAI